MQSLDLSSSLNLGNHSQLVRLACWWARCPSSIRIGLAFGQQLFRTYGQKFLPCPGTKGQAVTVFQNPGQDPGRDGQNYFIFL